MGWLLPTFHKRYWIGLNATTLASAQPGQVIAGQLQTVPARFAWLDKSAGIPYGQSYQHWGRLGSFAEPNNMNGSENCGVASAASTYSMAWGWADLNCKVSAPDPEAVMPSAKLAMSPKPLMSSAATLPGSGFT